MDISKASPSYLATNQSLIPTFPLCHFLQLWQPFHLAPIYFVDNVATSGNTLAACSAALFGFGTGLVYADASR